MIVQPIVQPPAPIPPLPQAANPTVNVLELLKQEEEEEMKEKKKGKMKTADTMPIKRTQFGAVPKMQEADASPD